MTETGSVTMAVEDHPMTPTRRCGKQDFPVGPLQEAFEASGLTAADVARRLGWYENKSEMTRRGLRRYRTADGSRVMRALGFRSQTSGNGYSGTRKYVSFEMAERLTEAIGLDPWEVGL